MSLLFSTFSYSLYIIAFSNLELSSHAYDFPSLTTSMKLEQRDFEASNKEHIYDYAKVHKLERSEYVVNH